MDTARICCWAMLLAGAGMMWPPGASLCAQDRLSAEEAKRLLRERGLVRKGFVWLSPSEVRLQSALAELPKLEREWRELQKEIGEQRDRHRTIRRGLKQRASLQEELKNNELTDKQKRQLMLALAALEKSLEQLGLSSSESFEPRETVALAPQLKELSRLHGRLIAQVLAAERLSDAAILQSYQPYRGDEAIMAALAALGDKAKLGPQRSTYKAVRQKAEQQRKLTFTDWLPLYQQDGQFWITAVVEGGPVDFQFRPELNFTLIPIKALRKNGFRLTDDMPLVKLNLGKRALTGYRMQVDAVRLGKYEVRNVPVIVLPDGENELTAVLGQPALGSLRVRIDEENLVFRIGTPEETPEPADAP